MKVPLAIVLTAEPSDGGKFTYSISFLNALDTFSKDEYEITIIYFNDIWSEYIAEKGSRQIKCKRPGLFGRFLRVFVLQLPFGLAVWRTLNRFVFPIHKLLYQLNPFLTFYPSTGPLVYETKVPVCTLIHDLMHRYEPQFPEVSEGDDYTRREKYYKSICKYVNVILAESDVGKKHILESYTVNPQNIFVLPSPPPPYAPFNPDKIDVRDKYSLPDQFIFYPAQFWKHKNHLGIIKAIDQIKREGTVVNAVFSGATQQQQYYEELIDTIDRLNLNDQIFCLGFVESEDIVALYKSARALVMPTFFGPTNVPPLEAFTFGCPVVTSGIYGIPAQLADAALYVNPRDIEDIASKILMIWTNEELRQHLISKGYEQLKNCNFDSFSRRLLTIVENDLAGSLAKYKLSRQAA